MSSPNKIVDNQRSDTWYRRLVESTSAIPWELDPATWRFTLIGEEIVDLLGYSIDDWYGEDFWLEHIHPDDKSWASKFCQTAAEKNEDHEIEDRFFAYEGRSLWIRDEVSVVENHFGK